MQQFLVVAQFIRSLRTDLLAISVGLKMFRIRVFVNFETGNRVSTLAKDEMMSQLNTKAERTKLRVKPK